MMASFASCSRCSIRAESRSSRALQIVAPSYPLNSLTVVGRIMRHGSLRSIMVLRLLRRMRGTSSNSSTDVHPGVIVLRESGLSRDEQWDRIRPVIEHIKDSGDDDFLLNKLIEIGRRALGGARHSVVIICIGRARSFDLNRSRRLVVAW